MRNLYTLITLLKEISLERLSLRKDLKVSIVRALLAMPIVKKVT